MRSGAEGQSRHSSGAVKGRRVPEVASPRTHPDSYGILRALTGIRQHPSESGDEHTLAVNRAGPELDDLYRLADQLERDRAAPVSELRRRDHALAATTAGADPCQRLLAWLDAVAPREQIALPFTGGAAMIARALALFLGFSAMAGFLFANSRGLVNVFVLLLLFVALQLALSLIGAVVLLRSLGGAVPTSLPMHPARWVARRSLPDARYLREAKPVLRLLLLRYGQEWGALFTVAAALAFVAVPAVSDFSFVWGSTFDLGIEFIAGLTDALAVPWSAWLPAATLDNDVLASTRFHPALTDLNRAEIEDMRGWWPFLFLCLMVYALLPRVLLWAGSRIAYRRQLRRSFVGFPGAELVLARLDRPLVSTQGGDAGDEAIASSGPETRPAPAPHPADPHRLLLDWGGALAEAGAASFEELRGIAESNRVAIGAGSLRDDRQRLAALDSGSYRQLAVVVKSWEPPMAELADLLAPLQAVAHCTLYLVPLGGEAVPQRRIDDWHSFSRKLPFAGVDVQVLREELASA